MIGKLGNNNVSKFVIVKCYKLWESVCNTIHHLLEYMGSVFKDLVFGIGHELTTKTSSLRALPIYSSKWYFVLQTDSYNKLGNITY